ncbi:MAG: PAS domain-containing protein [Clostridiales bacterium]|nr:PAS domain-containing protein [Clostridiales bacterium]MDY3745429.1 [Fe-Fe] hydrogenase large subunit C-terminal domain-containing protein [Lachnospiraceae bacterium]
MGNIGFKKAKCKDCFKCVRICPVKAVRRRNEQAHFVAQDCVLCGQCLESCPQHAVTVFSDIDKVKQYISDGEDVVLTVSPSYLGAIDETEPGQYIEALYQLGFHEIRETAEGAIYVTDEYDRLIHEGTMENILTSSCPVINSMVEKYYPDLIQYMAPVVPPVIAHGRILRQEYGSDVRIVSLTPCLAESVEAVKDERTRGVIDAVITFKEVRQWMRESGIDVTKCETYHHKRRINPKINGAYAAAGGIISALRAKSGEQDDYKRICVDGVEQCMDVLECVRKGELTHCFIELNSCVSGCVNGPVSGKKLSERFRSQMLVQERVKKEYPVYEAKPDISLHKEFIAHQRIDEMPDETQIREILAKIGKDTPEKELNCGACGYNTCREKAIAVYQRRSDLGMCVNYMYEQVRSLSEVIMSVTPEMIIIVDEELKIKEFNNAAEVAFNISRDEAVTKYLYEIIDAEDFQEVFQNRRSIMNKKVVYKSYKLSTIQNIIYVRNQHVAIGFFRNITNEEKEKANRMKLRMAGVNIAQEIIDKQMMVAQEIAGLLGETTAETKMALSKLRDSMLADEDQQI